MYLNHQNSKGPLQTLHIFFLENTAIDLFTISGVPTVFDRDKLLKATGTPGLPLEILRRRPRLLATQ